MITHILHRELGTVEPLRPADEESRNASGPDRADLSGNGAILVRQEGRHGSHENWVQFLKILAHKVIQHSLRRRVVLPACGVEGVRQHSRVGDRGDGVDLDVVVGPFGGQHTGEADQPGLGGAVIAHSLGAQNPGGRAGVELGRTAAPPGITFQAGLIR